MCEIEPLSGEVKDSIKAVFPWAILIFLCLYSFFSIRRKTSSIFLPFQQYVYIITIYAGLLNLFFFSKGKDVLIPLNLSVLYLVLLLIFRGFNRFLFIRHLKFIQSSKLHDWVPPIVSRFLVAYLPKAHAYIKEKPSAPFIIAFMVLLIICVFLLIFKAEKAAEQLANIAYFALVIGVGIKVYWMIKYGEKDEKE